MKVTGAKELDDGSWLIATHPNGKTYLGEWCRRGYHKWLVFYNDNGSRVSWWTDILVRRALDAFMERQEESRRRELIQNVGGCREE